MGHLINTTASSLVSGTVSTASDEPQKLTQLRPSLGVGLSACRTEWTGQLFPQPRLQSGELLDDLVGRRSAILMRHAFLQQLPRQIIMKMEKLGYNFRHSEDNFDYFKKDGKEYKIDRYDKDHIIHNVE